MTLEVKINREQVPFLQVKIFGFQLSLVYYHVEDIFRVDSVLDFLSSILRQSFLYFL